MSDYNSVSFLKDLATSIWLDFFHFQIWYKMEANVANMTNKLEENHWDQWVDLTTAHHQIKYRIGNTNTRNN